MRLALPGTVIALLACPVPAGAQVRSDSGPWAGAANVLHGGANRLKVDAIGG